MNNAVEKMREEDWEEVRSIYLDGIARHQACYFRDGGSALGGVGPQLVVGV